MPHRTKNLHDRPKVRISAEGGRSVDANKLFESSRVQKILDRWSKIDLNKNGTGAPSKSKQNG